MLVAKKGKIKRVAQKAKVNVQERNKFTISGAPRRVLVCYVQFRILMIESRDLVGCLAKQTKRP